MHAGVNFIAGAIEETGVYENQPFPHRAYALLQVDSRAALLVHDADFERIPLDTQHILDTSEQVVRECRLGRPVHFRLDDVHAVASTVRQAVRRQCIGHGTGRGYERIEHALEDFVAAGIEYRIRRHQVTDIADEHQAAAGQHE